MKATDSQSLGIPIGLAKILRDLVHEKTGIFFEDDRLDLLIEKLEPLAKAEGFASNLDFYYALKDRSPAAWDRTWDALSVQETYFWREFAQVRVLVDTIIPDWFKRTSAPFRIWSAASATGEEPYSLAMALDQAGFGAHPIRISASDASPAALAKAAIGIYREKSFRSLPPELREKYFQAVPGGWKISPTIATRVRWARINLSDDAEIATLGRMEAIFCRNVFIYFSPHAIRRTVATFATKMPSGGHLFVGASESLLRMTTDFELREIAGSLVYVRI